MTHFEYLSIAVSLVLTFGVARSLSGISFVLIVIAYAPLVFETPDIAQAQVNREPDLASER